MPSYWLGPFTRLFFIGTALVFFPKTMLCLLLCGIIDVSVSRPLNRDLIQQYFLTYTITWLLSPINLLADLLTWSRKPVYAWNDLPKACQNEIQYVLENLDTQFLIEHLEKKIDGRNMILFKWYGKNIETPLPIDAFKKEFKYVKTIGISVFNKQTSVCRHFGPLRLMLRVLYNMNPVQNDAIYIEVNNKKYVWAENPLLIFDDTYIHQSFNQSPHIRYNLYLDILRDSSYFHRILNSLVHFIQLVVNKTNQLNVAYGLWKFIK